MRLRDFPNHDPGDELIAATARVHKLTLLTTDIRLKIIATRAFLISNLS